MILCIFVVDFQLYCSDIVVLDAALGGIKLNHSILLQCLSERTKEALF